MSDKRQFQRIKLNIDGFLTHHATSIPVTIADVSLQGLRLCADEQQLNKLPFDSHEPYLARFQLNNDSPLVTLYIEQLYRQSDSRRNLVMLGCKLDHGDIDSVIALRRIIQLNSTDDALCESDLDAFIDAIYSNASNA